MGGRVLSSSTPGLSNTTPDSSRGMGWGQSSAGKARSVQFRGEIHEKFKVPAANSQHNERG